MFFLFNTYIETTMEFLCSTRASCKTIMMKVFEECQRLVFGIIKTLGRIVAHYVDIICYTVIIIIVCGFLYCY